MSYKTMTVLMLGALVAAGCTREASEPVAETTVAAPAPGPEQWCRVCEVDKGERLPEYLPSRLDVVREGQTYRFCNDGCRAKFDAAPESYVLPGGAAPAEPPGGAVDAADPAG